MPEHETPDLADLDAAFTRLEQDIASSSHPRGAGAAIATARRRRRTRVGAVAAVTVLAVGGLAIAEGVGAHHASVGPADLPAAAPYDEDALNAATRGWTSGWKTLTDAHQFVLEGTPLKAHCIGFLLGTVQHPVTPSPVRSGGGPAIAAADDELTFASLFEWSDEHPNAPSNGYSALVSSVDGCAQATSGHDYTWDGARAQSWDVSGSGSTPQRLWVAEQGRAIGVVWMGGSAGAVPDDVDQRVAAALVAGLRSPESFTRAEPPDSGSSSETSPTELPSFQHPSLNQFQSAFGTWPSGLVTQGDSRDFPTTPCLPASLDGSSGGGAASIGQNGAQNDFVFDSPASAAAGLRQASRLWRECTETGYTVTSVDVPGQGTVTVATSAGPKAATNWAVQDGRYVLVLSINGGSNPPEEVSAAIGALLYDVVTRPAPGR